jgi:hypothetical protein
MEKSMPPKLKRTLAVTARAACHAAEVRVLPANAPQSEGAAALLKFLRSPKVIAVIRAKGMKDFGSGGGSE